MRFLKSMVSDLLLFLIDWEIPSFHSLAGAFIAFSKFSHFFFTFPPLLCIFAVFSFFFPCSLFPWRPHAIDALPPLFSLSLCIITTVHIQNSGYQPLYLRIVGSYYRKRNAKSLTTIVSREGLKVSSIRFFS